MGRICICGLNVIGVLVGVNLKRPTFKTVLDIFALLALRAFAETGQGVQPAFLLAKNIAKILSLFFFPLLLLGLLLGLSLCLFLPKFGFDVTPPPFAGLFSLFKIRFILCSPFVSLFRPNPRVYFALFPLLLLDSKRGFHFFKTGFFSSKVLLGLSHAQFGRGIVGQIGQVLLAYFVSVVGRLCVGVSAHLLSHRMCLIILCNFFRRWIQQPASGLLCEVHNHCRVHPCVLGFAFRFVCTLLRNPYVTIMRFNIALCVR